MELIAKLMIKENDQVFLGPGVRELLALIESEKSVKDASRKMELSYSKAWTIIRNAEAGANIQLVKRSHGGHSGGSSELTDEGKNLLERYLAFEREAGLLLSECFRRHFDG